MEFIGISIDVLLITSTLALAAFGLAIIYGLIGVINMGHGAMLTLGAYLTWYFISLNIPFFFMYYIFWDWCCISRNCIRTFYY